MAYRVALNFAGSNFCNFCGFVHDAPKKVSAKNLLHKNLFHCRNYTQTSTWNIKRHRLCEKENASDNSGNNASSGTVVIADPRTEQSATLGQDVSVIEWQWLTLYICMLFRLCSDCMYSNKKRKCYNSNWTRLPENRKNKSLERKTSLSQSQKLVHK